MQKLFNKILVPVDFSAKSKKAVEKAVGIALDYDCSITLLHVVTTSPLSAVAVAEGHMAIPYNIIDNKTELEFQLEKLAAIARLLSANKIKTDHLVIRGTWDEVIIEMVNQHQFDLVLIGQKGRIFRKRKMMLNPDKIAAKSNIPVITIPSNRRFTRLLSIVIPITDFLPVRKLIYGVYIASKYNTTIKLLGIENEKTNVKVQFYLQKAYQLIQQNSTLKVELDTIVSNNVAEAVSQFAMIHSADLVILNPGAQTKMPGFFSALFGRIVQKYSAPPVLSINPV